MAHGYRRGVPEHAVQLIGPVIIGEPRANQNITPILLCQGRGIKEPLAISTGQEDHRSLNTLGAFGGAARGQGHEIGQEIQDRFHLGRSEPCPDPLLQSIAHHTAEYAYGETPITRFRSSSWYAWTTNTRSYTSSSG